MFPPLPTRSLQPTNGIHFWEVFFFFSPNLEFISGRFGPGWRGGADGTKVWCLEVLPNSVALKCSTNKVHGLHCLSQRDFPAGSKRSEENTRRAGSFLIPSTRAFSLSRLPQLQSFVSPTVSPSPLSSLFHPCTSIAPAPLLYPHRYCTCTAIVPTRSLLYPHLYCSITSIVPASHSAPVPITPSPCPH